VRVRKKQVVSQLTALDTALEEYAEDLAAEKFVEPGEALSSFMRSVGEVDLNELKDDIAFNWTPELANYLGERTRDVASAIESVGLRSFLSDDHSISQDYIIDAVRRVQEIIRRSLEKTAPERTEATDNYEGYAPADTIEMDHGISRTRLSQGKREGKIKWKNAPPGMRDSQGRNVRILYHVADAKQHYSPKQFKSKSRKKPALGKCNQLHLSEKTCGSWHRSAGFLCN